jgi:superfamily II RNA helicase
MAGRAGRRGKDKTGSCLIILDRNFGRNIPTVDDFERLLENKGTPLESKLKLSYAMTMNVMKSDSIMIEDMLKVSWFESENEKERVDAMKRANAIQKRMDRIGTLDCPNGCTYQAHLKPYMELYKEACIRNRNIMTIVNRQVESKSVVECFAPQFFGEPVLVIRGNTEDDNQLICLYIRENYQGPTRFEEDDPSFVKQSGEIKENKNIFYEYIRLRPDQVGRIFNEGLWKMSMTMFIDKEGKLVRILLF